MGCVLNKKNTILSLIIGIWGCVLMASSDWLMIYGNTAYKGNLAWLTEGVALIKPWRNSLAMALSIPAVILYTIALLYIANFITEDKPKKLYILFTTIGLTPWLCLHLFYTMILYLFAYLSKEVEKAVALHTCEVLFSHFAFLIPLTQALMLLPFIYLFILFIKNKTIFSKVMCLNNPLLIYVVLKLITAFIPDIPFRLAFTNGLMSEAMLIWFIILIIGFFTNKKEAKLS